MYCNLNASDPIGTPNERVPLDLSMIVMPSSLFAQLNCIAYSAKLGSAIMALLCSSARTCCNSLAVLAGEYALHLEP